MLSTELRLQQISPELIEQRTFETNWLGLAGEVLWRESDKRPEQRPSVYIRSKNDKKELIPAYDYYVANGVKPELLAGIIDEESHFIFGENGFDEEIDLLADSPQEIKSKLLKRTLPIHQLVDVFLPLTTQAKQFGAHGEVHVDFVASDSSEQVGESMRAVGFTEGEIIIEQKQTSVGGIIHDVLCAFDRELHPFGGNEIVRLIFPEAYDAKKLGADHPYGTFFDRVVQIILLHDEKIAASVMGTIAAHIDPEHILDKRDFYKKFYGKVLDVFGYAGLAMVWSDKKKGLDQHRVNGQIVVDANGRVVRQPTTDYISLLSAEITNVRMIETNGGKCIAKAMDFAPLVEEGEQTNQFLESMVDKKRRLLLLKNDHEIHEQLGIPNLLGVWLPRFFQFYGNRVLVEAISCFALHPQCEKYQIQVIDSENNLTQTVTMEIDRNGLDEWIQLVNDMCPQPGSKGLDAVSPFIFDVVSDVQKNMYREQERTIHRVGSARVLLNIDIEDDKVGWQTQFKKLYQPWEYRKGRNLRGEKG